MDNNQTTTGLIQASIIRNWDREALTDYKGATLFYRDVARRIEKLHILFEAAGISRGDKIALCGKNCSNWAVACLASLSYGAVIVPVLHEFKPDNIHNIVNHSEARLLFAGSQIWENLNEASIPGVEGIIILENLDIAFSRNDALTEAREHLNELFGRRYPRDFKPSDVHYVSTEPEDLAMINYTSGSTGFSKGVMLPYRSIENNRAFAIHSVPILKSGDSVISMLPMAHMYSFAFEFFYEFTMGCHIYFLTRLPSPKVIFQAFNDIKPKIIIAVPLVIEKIIKKNVLPRLETAQMKLLLKMPIAGEQIKKKVRDELVRSFGGEFYEIIIGGAAFNQEVENFLASVHFPYTVGYGATECGPIICYQDWKSFIPGSCGKAAYGMEVKILSSDPENIPGEIICRGPNVMLGYYRNDKLSEETIDSDGWLYTGDLGIMDNDGNVFIKGRSKSLILGPSGQNIYPEEIEDKLNNMPCVSESVVISENSKLVALVYPDYDETMKQGMDDEQIAACMEENRCAINRELPMYEQITQIRIYHEEFEKTPKKSIKRFLYQKE
ncbi:MAG: AMP-binding protein [Bacteroidaceae bacterium]|nr:AMP-binding protein [Bacteroidaceae bacterium]